MTENHELQVLVFRGDIEHEDDKRRVTSRVGYYLVDSWQRTLIGYALIVLPTQLVVLFGVAFAGGLPRGATNDPRTLLLFLPMMTLPIFPFLIMKLRYALRVLAVLAVLGGLVWLSMVLQEWVVSQIA